MCWRIFGTQSGKLFQNALKRSRRSSKFNISYFRDILLLWIGNKIFIPRRFNHHTNLTKTYQNRLLRVFWYVVITCDVMSSTRITEGLCCRERPPHSIFSGRPTARRYLVERSTIVRELAMEWVLASANSAALTCGLSKKPRWPESRLVDLVLSNKKRIKWKRLTLKQLLCDYVRTRSIEGNDEENGGDCGLTLVIKNCCVLRYMKFKFYNHTHILHHFPKGQLTESIKNSQKLRYTKRIMVTAAFLWALLVRSLMYRFSVRR